MGNEDKMAMYEAQAIAIEQQIEIDKLKREKEEMSEKMKQLELQLREKSEGPSNSKSGDEGKWTTQVENSNILEIASILNKSAKEYKYNKKIPDIPPDSFEKLPKEMTILLLGEEGMGKSTFINGIANYLKYTTLQKAEENGVEVLIRTHFTSIDTDDKEYDVRCNPTVTVEEASEEQSDRFGTQYPKSYKLTWRQGGQERVIRIIDTPGFGSRWGVRRDKENVERIHSYLANFKQINAICILLKPNVARLTVDFRYCLNEILGTLHMSAVQNIMFCFTNCRRTLYRPAETLNCLEYHLGELKSNRNIEIPLNLETIYCFDNEGFRYLCALTVGGRFDEREKEGFNESWVKSVEETFRLFRRIAELEPYDVEKTLCMNNIRSALMSSAERLPEMAKNMLLNSRLIEETIKEIEDRKAKQEDLKQRLYVNQVSVIARPLDHPMTVCTAAKCVDHEHIDSDPNMPMKTIYKTECHKKCYDIGGMAPEQVPNPALQNCVALRGNINQCRTCGCPWNTHMHIKFLLDKKMERVVDPTIQKRINENQDWISTAEKFLENEKKRKEKLIRESETMAGYVSAVGAFLNKNSILPYNDAYVGYVNELIQRVVLKNGWISWVEETIPELENYKEKYQQLINQLEKSPKDSGKEQSIAEIYQTVEDMKKMIRK